MYKHGRKKVIMKTTTNTTKNNVTVNTIFNFKKIKIDVSKADKTLLQVISDYQLSRFQQADKKLIMNRIIKSEKIKLQLMIEQKDVTDTTRHKKYNKEDIDRQNTYIDGLIKQRDEYIKTCKQLETNARAIINKELYSNYCNGELHKGLADLFEQYNITLTDTAYKYFIQVIGLKNATNNQIFTNKMLLSNKGYTAFTTSILNGLTDLLAHKNVLSTVYSWEYVPTPKKTKKQTDTKIKKTKKVA